VTSHRLSRVLGRVLVAFGTIVLLFVAYQLWGTRIVESRSQDTLRREFEQQLHRVGTPTTTTSPEPGSTTVSPVTTPTPVGSGSVPAEGRPVGTIRIPKLGVSAVVVEGVAAGDLRQGPGHYPGTPLPGQAGNAAIAGHRTTYGAPFFDLNELGPGDDIEVTTTQGAFRFRVTRTLVVAPSDASVIAPTLSPELTLTTCNPRFSASQRLVVQASLDSIPAPTPSPSPPGGTTTPGTARAASTAALAGANGPWIPALTWGLVVLCAVVAIWQLAKRQAGAWREVVYGAGGVVVLLLLFFFFGAVSPLLPASF